MKERNPYLDPFLFNPGDLGNFVTIIDRHPDGSDWLRDVPIPGTALFTGRIIKTAPELHPERPRDPLPNEIPIGHRWPTELGDDPR